MPIEQHSDITINLPKSVVARLEDMAFDRDMTLRALVGELVIVGLQSLKYPDAERDSTIMGVDPSDDGFAR